MVRGAARERLRGELWYLLAIAAAVAAANVPYLVAAADANPLGPRSGLASLVSAGPLPGERSVDPNDGFTSQALGHRAALDLLHLHAPWWNPYEGTGAPLAAEMQSAALFPPTLLTALSNGQLYEHLLLELLAGVFTYLLLRRLALAPWASAAAGIAYAINGTFAWLAHAPVNAVPFLPLLLLGIELAYSATVAGRRGGFAAIALAGAFSVYAGFPEVAYVGALLGVCWFAWRAACVGRGRLGPFVAKGAAGVVVGTLLAAPLLVLSADYVSQASLGGHADAGAGHLPAAAASQLALPYVYGPLFAFSDPKLVVFGVWGSVGGFLSVSLILFGLVGLAAGRHRGLTIVLGAWLVLALSRMFGVPVLGAVLGTLPGMSRVAFYRYGYPSVELAVVVLAALGLDRLAASPLPRREVAWTSVAALILVALAGAEALPYARRLGSGSGQIGYLEASAAWGVAVVLAGAGAMLLRSPRARVVAASGLVVAEAVLLFLVPEASAPRRVVVDTAPVAYLQRHLDGARFFTLGPLQPNYGSYFGIASLNVNDLPVPTAFAGYVNRSLDQAVEPTVFVGDLGGGRPAAAPSPETELLRNVAGYRAAGVAYVLAPAGRRLPAKSFALVFRSPTTWIYHLGGGAPLITAPGCTVATGTDSALLSCRRRTVLIRRETDLPGWHATVDGRSVRVQTVDGLFQALPVGPGSHRVTFSYSPPHLDWALAAFVLGCAALIAPSIRAPSRSLRP